jgi:hypothetical protein
MDIISKTLGFDGDFREPQADRQVLGLVVKVDEEAFDAWQHHHHSQRGHTSRILRIHNHNDDLLHMLI